MPEPPKITRELSIDDVRDFMKANPTLTPEEAAFQLWHLYPQYSYEQSLQATRLVQSVFELVDKHEAEHPDFH